MRNYSSNVPAASTVAWFADTDLSSPEVFKKLLERFNRLFENPVYTPVSQMTPSEQRVIRDFLRYAGAVRRRKSDCNKDHPGSFVYINMNTGEMVVFVTWYGYGEYSCDSWVL